MAGTKIKAKFRAKVRPPEGKDKRPPIKPVMAADSGLLTAKIITVVERKKEAENAQKEGKNEKD